jgi:hypothetical protein
MNLTRKETVLQGISALFIFLFVYTAVSKLSEFSKFVHVLGTSPLIGGVNIFMAWAIPLTELGTSLLLLFPETRKVGMNVAFILMSFFSVYVGYMILFAPHLPCSCGGIIQNLTWTQHLSLNLILWLIAAIAAFQDKFFVATNRGNRKPVTE